MSSGEQSSHYLHMETWAGHRKYPVTIVGETPTRFRVLIDHDGGVNIRNRHAEKGSIVLVPKYAISDK